MKPIALALCICALLVGCSKDENNIVPTSNAIHEVLLKAQASNFQTSSVTWNNDGNTGGPTGFTGSWAMYISCPAGTRISVTVYAANQPNPNNYNIPIQGSITASIIVDGVVWKQEGSSGQTASATASGMVP